MSFIKSALKAIIITLIVLFTLSLLVSLAMPTEEEIRQDANEFMDEVKLDVAEDAVVSFNLAKEYGTAIDRCVAAQQVAAAYQMAQSTAQYAKWKGLEREECAGAGLGY